VAVAIFDSGSSVGGNFYSLDCAMLRLAFGNLFFRACLAFYGLLCGWPFTRRASESSVGAGAQHLQRLLLPLRRREAWAIVIGRSLTDPIWWFYVFWLPNT
jgi:MFS transporter, ACS family, hexuronate transporter